MKQLYDVVVVGSGFGGAVVAFRLAQVGRSVCVLERGKRWRKGEFPSRFLELLRHGLWNEQKSYGHLDYRVFDGVEVIQGAGVGGGSLHYYNVNLRPVEAVLLGTERWPAAIEPGVLDPYYALAEAMLRSRPIVPPPGYPWPPRTKAFLEAALCAGGSPSCVPLAVKFQPTAPGTAPPEEAPDQQTCDYRGNCLLGCNRYAKNTTDLNYLRLAEQRYGAQVRPLCVAYNIEPRDGAYRVHYRQLDPSRPGRFTCCSVAGREVVVAAGALGSTELLLRSRDRYRTLPQVSPMLGRHFSTNGDYLYAGAVMNRRVRPTVGPSITAGADFSTSHHRIFIEDAGISDAMGILLFATVRRKPHLFNFLRNRFAARAGNAVEHQRPIDRQRHRGGTVERFLPFLAMGTDAANGVMTLRGGDLDVCWNPAASGALFRQMRATFEHICRCSDAEFRESLWLQATPGRMLVAHPLGGCVMGDDPQQSVVDHRGRVWGYPGLYVADGSIVPSPLATNPSLTICALAERVAFWMLHQREMQRNDPEAPGNG